MSSPGPLGEKYCINNSLIVIKTLVIVISLLQKSEETVENNKISFEIASLDQISLIISSIKEFLNILTKIQNSFSLTYRNSWVVDVQLCTTYTYTKLYSKHSVYLTGNSVIVIIRLMLSVSIRPIVITLSGFHCTILQKYNLLHTTV